MAVIEYGTCALSRVIQIHVLKPVWSLLYNSDTTAAGCMFILL